MVSIPAVYALVTQLPAVYTLVTQLDIILLNLSITMPTELMIKQ